MDIPEEKRPEYARQALKLLKAGGMMGGEEVKLYGRRLALLKPLELDENNCARGWYNYFERRSWENWYLDGEKGGLSSGKIGYAQFSTAIMAVNIFDALCSRNYNVVAYDGVILTEAPFVGWINYVLGTQFSNQRVTKVWQIGKLLHTEENRWVWKYSKNPVDLMFDQIDTIPPECVDQDELSSFTSVWFLGKNLANQKYREEAAQPGMRETVFQEGYHGHHGYYSLIYLYDALKEFRAAGGTLEQAEAYLYMTPEQRMQRGDPRDREMLMAYNCALEEDLGMAIAKVFGLDLYDYWDKVRARVPRYSSPRPPKPCPPVEPVSTQTLFHIRSDDMVYYWEPDGRVQFSEELKQWMNRLRAELDGIIEAIAPENFLKTLVENIDSVQMSFFEETFYELIARQQEPRVQAAVILEGRLAARKDPYIRQYHALLGNRRLRETMLGF